MKDGAKILLFFDIHKKKDDFFTFIGRWSRNGRENYRPVSVP